MISSDATFQLTSNGNMQLIDSRNVLVWSTNTSGSSVAGLNLTETGNLVLFDVNNLVVWQSFDHPTDTLLPGQKLWPEQNLIASVSESNCSEGLYSYGAHNNEVFLYVGPSIYYNGIVELIDNRSLIHLRWDGHLTRFRLDTTLKEATDLLEDELSNCQYPMVCGKYGICENGECSCPHSAYFTQDDMRQPNLGCSHITPLDCDASHLHSFVEILEARYFTFSVDIHKTDENTCKEACLSNCSCKAVMLNEHGDCYLPTQIYSIVGMDDDDDKLKDYNFSIYLKVQTTPKGATSRRNHVLVIIEFTVVVVLATAVVSVLFWMMMIRNPKWDGEVEEDELGNPSTLSVRFSFKELKTATWNFSIKIGEGAFGSVFQGSLKDGTKIAVKCLDKINLIDNSFLMEIRSIGNIHHVNLVRLIGYCTERSCRLLVYEYMANGSLEKWLSEGRSQKSPLDWNRRKCIVIGIAKGLAYLHEDCRQKIVHTDVKPRNIMLDENYNVKITGFGLSKLFSRDQTNFFTTMRGTSSYLAPEWLSSVITEKVDVYNFGVVTLEILCGRKVFDMFQQHQDRIHLLSFFCPKS